MVERSAGLDQTARLSFDRLITLARSIGQRIGDDDLTAQAGNVAFNLILSLFPGLIFVAALAGFIGSFLGVDSLFDQILGYLTSVLPESAVETIKGPLEGILKTQSGGLLSFGILGALWAASGATAAMMQACNRIHRVRETRPFWQHRLLIAVGLTLLLGLLVLIAFALLIFGGQLGGLFAAFIGLEAEFSLIWNLARWPIILVALILAVGMLYWLGPNARRPFRWLTPGSVIAILLWLLFTGLFGLYVANFNNYSNSYGAIAGVIVLLVWLNYSSLVILIGALIDQVLEGAPGLSSTASSTSDTSITATFRPGSAEPAGPGESWSITAPLDQRPSIPAWLPLATLGAWLVIILAGALRRGGR